MSNTTPTTPSFILGYWRPWKEESNLFDSYLDYVKDTSLVRYGAQTIGSYVTQASSDQIRAINSLGRTLGGGLSKVSTQLSDISHSLSDISSTLSGMSRVMSVISGQLDRVDGRLAFMNRQLDIQIDQQRITNLMLQNISELLRVPDSEKERQRNIELGMKFYLSGQNNPDLYADALEELLQAEAMMKQDYFVLHRIGCIYLYVERFIDPVKAQDYFLRAAKYASIDSDPTAVRLANVLTQHFQSPNTAVNQSVTAVGALAAESYEKAAFASYVGGKVDQAIQYQQSACRLRDTPHYQFLLAKYLARGKRIDESAAALDIAIDYIPELALAAMSEVDLISEPAITELINKKAHDVDSQFEYLTNAYSLIGTSRSVGMTDKLQQTAESDYGTKRRFVADYLLALGEAIDRINGYQNEADRLLQSLGNMRLTPTDAAGISGLITDLEGASSLPIVTLAELCSVATRELSTMKDRGSRHFNLEKKLRELADVLRNSAFTNKSEQEIQDILRTVETAIGKPSAEMELAVSIAAPVCEYNRVTIGSRYGGGIVFYIDKSGKHGLICSKTDIDCTWQCIWGVPGIINAAGRKIYDGRQNTDRISELASMRVEKGFLRDKQVPIETGAQLCINSDHMGYNDWYLPSVEELKMMLQNLDYTLDHHSREFRDKLHALKLAFSIGDYMSSTEKSENEFFKVTKSFRSSTFIYEHAASKTAPDHWHIRGVRRF